MQNLINQIHKLLLKSQQTLSIAESCTSGLLSSLLTQLPGSSSYFLLGITAYSNNSKQNILKVPSSIIKKKGAVSQEVARLMSQNVQKLGHADIGIAITGIAGPTGATARKPIGLVFIAFTKKNKTICRKFIFKGNRSSIRKQATSKTLKLLKQFII
ncbi:MAG: CinA family protein [Candidatus Omnitrophica bacterium]|nr:CinA family protein [Candidatus Omnitrophota bacterium]